ncbi:GTPase Era [Campylobacter vulpis]|uniref:GTPase Era n=1 Tax=Campylobacter vulpis TaxID=1655500 RepID=UPI000C14CB06|nr:GTPase Era [Campylobacter vulpis]MBS4275952.1 GTPase Era [Campylobacter vulpis]MBS4307362.1 GTPase Era [Campylobacter vulpis]MBS4330283.1 GTPase Era [Campylobacter vulpis]MBS4423908.1 GTPase Era [Campylobacter vulpis]PHY89539.1 GTPase Era [Campylobacter vulpis]
MKSGFISLIGRTNAGKSTLINSLLEEKIALVSHKQNATRRKIKAIVMQDDNQLIFIDTPGLHESKASFNQLLIQSALKAMKDCDVIVFVASVFDEVSDYEKFLTLKPQIPHLVVLNKVDLAKNEEVLQKLSEYAKFSGDFQAIVPYSARQKSYKKALLDAIVKLLPKHEHFYDPAFLTPSSQKELFRDFILESLYENLSEELPYCSEVLAQSVKEKSNLFVIHAQIITDTNSHKAMIIGKEGATLRRIGQKARIKIENLTQKKVLLKLFVVVKKAWQKDEKFAKQMLGYEE